MSSLNYDLHIKSLLENNNNMKYKAFKSKAIDELSYCLQDGGDIHELIENIQGNYWDIFLTDISNNDMNELIEEAVLHVKKKES